MSTPTEIIPVVTVPAECANCGTDAGADPEFCGDCARPLCATCVAEIIEEDPAADPHDLICDDCIDEELDELDDDDEEEDDDYSDDDEDDDTD